MELDLSEELKRESEALGQLLDLVRGEVDPSDWPVEAASHLSRAMTPTGNHLESEKALRLRDHLFSDLPLHPAIVHFDWTRGEARIADRLRADLADLLPYAAGLYVYEKNIELAGRT